MAVTSSLWSLRRFSPIKKAGLSLVRKAHNLRPISLTSDMAQISDGLWVGRNKHKLETHAGPEQTEGVSDPCSLVVAVVILAQLRHHQGLQTLPAFLDFKWAFDCANIPGMLVACFAAGIGGIDWLLMDDIMRSDKQCLQLHSFLSCIFAFVAGTAQGRTFSVHVFNALLKHLRGEIMVSVPSGINAQLPPFALSTLQVATSICLSVKGVPPFTCVPLLKEPAGNIVRLAGGEPWPRAAALTIQYLTELRFESDRPCWSSLGRLGSARSSMSMIPPWLVHLSALWHVS